MAIPQLKLRKDVWTYFPVNMDAMGRGANGADRYGIEWHNMKVRSAAASEGISAEFYKQRTLPVLIKALRDSTAWTVEAPPPGGRFIAVIAMRFGGPVAAPPRNATRRLSPKRNASPPKNRKASKSPKASPTRKASKSPKASPTRKASPARLSGNALIKKARGILNILADSTVDRLSTEFANTIVPKTDADFAALMELILDTMLDTQAYHPLIIKLLQTLDAKHSSRPYPQKPSAALAALLLERVRSEPRFVLLDIQAEEGDIEMTNAVEEDIMRQKRYHRSAMLFLGFMYREGLLSAAQLTPVLQTLLAAAKTSDADYRLQDAAVQGLVFALMRAGQRLEMEAPAEMATYKTEIAGLAETIRRGAIRSLCLDFAEAAAEGYKIKEGTPWAVGAPRTDIRGAVKAPLLAAPVAPAAEGLGADIGELWRRFPLDVKEQGGVWVIRFHMKKLGERYAKEAGRYRSQDELAAALQRHILSLIDNSKHWRRGPVVPGALVTVVKA